ncbi:hypothetical protein VD0002_g4628 [Verticillium dahliae]|uniref:Transport protein yip1 n=3 Tax=Verticillium TaxID=1036719 RepID=G2XAV8_VERDV|nr:transport protein yip1 [Verticillium dahliae VdLs.17]KAH6666174.1 transport protein yip1 [Verticillium dahliae]CRK36184.1 hypothetical protein BN1708_006958 [Verticillium longisporum]EGY16173.1 transport protein yip1 [Verticillium dahliae VdLs.17]KAH6687133.1 transport protein yip1 [Verticillium dahliae]KAH6702748.1 transport protein yip1 [Verticillium dahliae]
MSNYYNPPPNQGYGAGPSAGAGAQNLQFYPSSYGPGVQGQGNQQASYGYGAQPGGQFGGAGSPGFGGGFGAAAGVSGRMGEQGGLRTGWLAAFSTEGYDGEPPLLEELGVNFKHIQTKTLAVLNPFRRIDQHIMDDSDLAGPILAFFLFGTFLLFSGKIHFGFIYGLAALGSVSLHLILSLMTPTELGPHEADSHTHPSAAPYPGSSSVGVVPGGAPGVSSSSSGSIPGKPGHFSTTLTFARSSSILGYCLLPLVATSLLGILMPMDTPLGIVITSAAILWCTYAASGMFVAIGRMMSMRLLIAYPLALFYVGFGIMGVFSSRGSTLAAAAAGLKA